MADESFAEAVERARSIADKLNEPYRSITFRVVLESILAEERSGLLAASGQPAQPTAERAVLPLESSPNEFLAATRPSTHVDRVVAIAYYSLRTGNATGATVKEILAVYGAVRERQPKNIHDMIAQCIRRGLLIEAPERKNGAKAYVVTPRGEAYVEAGFQEPER